MVALNPQRVKDNAMRRAKAFLDAHGMATDDFSTNLLFAHMVIDSLVDAMTEEGEIEILKGQTDG